MSHEQEKPLEERLQDLADKLCKVESLMYILTRTLYQECIGSEFDKAIPAALDSVHDTLEALHKEADEIHWCYQLTQSNGK